MSGWSFLKCFHEALLVRFVYTYIADRVLESRCCLHDRVCVGVCVVFSSSQTVGRFISRFRLMSASARLCLDAEIWHYGCAVQHGRWNLEYIDAVS